MPSEYNDAPTQYLRSLLDKYETSLARLLRAYLRNRDWSGLACICDCDWVVIDCASMLKDISNVLANLSEQQPVDLDAVWNFVATTGPFENRPVFQWLCELEFRCANRGLQVIVLHDVRCPSFAQEVIQHLRFCSDPLYRKSSNLDDFVKKQMEGLVLDAGNLGDQICRPIYGFTTPRATVRVKNPGSGAFGEATSLPQNILGFVLDDDVIAEVSGGLEEEDMPADWVPEGAKRIADAGVDVVMVDSRGFATGFVLPQRGYGRIVAWPMPAAEKNFGIGIHLGIEFVKHRQDTTGSRPGGLKRKWDAIVLEIGTDASGRQVRQPLHLQFKNLTSQETLDDLTPDHPAIRLFAKGKNLTEPRKFLDLLLTVEGGPSSSNQNIVIQRDANRNPLARLKKQKEAMQSAIEELVKPDSSKLPLATKEDRGTPIRNQPDRKYQEDDLYRYKVDFRIRKMPEKVSPAGDKDNGEE